MHTHFAQHMIKQICAHFEAFVVYIFYNAFKATAFKYLLFYQILW